MGRNVSGRVRGWLNGLSRLLVLCLILPGAGTLPGAARAAPARASVALRAAGLGNPWLNLRDGMALSPTYDGARPAVQALEGAQARPLSLATADFDADGVPDLVAGHAGPGDSGLLTLYRGNVDSIYPNTPEAQARSAEGTFTAAPFLSPARVFETPAPPDFLGAGDFDNDGRLDLVVAARGDAALHLLPGDGRGGFGTTEALPLPGGVTALAVGEVNRRDGLADVVVGIGGARPRVLVFEGPEGALRRAPETLHVPAEVAALLVGQLDDHYAADLAVAAGNDLLIVHGRDRRLALAPGLQAGVPPAVVDTHSFPLAITALALGDFAPDERSRPELAILWGDGTVHLWDATAGAIVTQYASRISTDGVPNARLFRANTSSLPADDLLLTVSTGDQIQVLNAQSPAPGPLASLDLAAAPVAILPMRLNADALDDLVILADGTQALTVVETAPVNTFLVNTSTDGSDGDTDDDICDTGNLDDGYTGLCTLLAAIEQANASAGADTISFAVSFINKVGLPAITDPVTIDGSSMGRVQLDGSGTPGAWNGLTIHAGSSAVRGMAIGHFGGSGVLIESNGSNVVEGNYIGTNAAGTGAQGNGKGIVVHGSSNNVIGGAAAAARNVVSGNTMWGISIFPTSYGVGGAGNVVLGNYVGTDATGAAALPNAQGGVSVSGQGNIIGGTSAAGRNVISGNDPCVDGGIYLDYSDGALVQGNYVGLTASGAARLANRSGVVLRAAHNNTIGGTASGAGNVISGNSYFGIDFYHDTSGTIVEGNRIGAGAGGGMDWGNVCAGVYVREATATFIGGETASAPNTIVANGGTGGFCGGVVVGPSATGVAISRNRIYDNGDFGIDLYPRGPNANDAGDLDEGANRKQNYPVITSVTVSGGAVVVAGALDSAPNTTFEIEFFGNDDCSPAGSDQGQYFLDSLSVTTDGSGAASFSHALPAPDQVGNCVTATATDPQGNTSEFSQRVALPIYRFKLAEPARAGLLQPITYTIGVNNVAGVPLPILVEDAIPAGTQYIPGSASASQGSPTYSNGRLSWSGTLAAGAELQVTFSVSTTCAAPGVIRNRAEVVLGGVTLPVTATTELLPPVLGLRASTQSFLPPSAFAPGHTALLYTVPEGGTFPTCSNGCPLDLYVVVNGDTAGRLRMTDDAAGLTDRQQPDFHAGDEHYSRWFKPATSTAQTLELYFDPSGAGFDDALRVDTLTLQPASRPSLVVLTDLRELFREFQLTSPGSATDDTDRNCIRDYYDALERLSQYADAHSGVLVDVRQDAYDSDFNYQDDNHRLRYMIAQLDWLVSLLPAGGLRYVAIVGDDAVLPFYRFPDPISKGAGFEGGYLAARKAGVGTGHKTIVDTWANYIMTDVPYSTRSLATPLAPSPDYALGRIFASTPRKLVDMIVHYEHPVLVGANTGSAYVFNIANEYRDGKLVFDWQANTASAASATLRNGGYTIDTDRLALRGWVRHRGWMDRQAGVAWGPAGVQYVLDPAGDNRLTILSSHASHTAQTTPGQSLTAAHLDRVSQFPGAVLISYGCHAGYTTGAPADDHYNNALARAAMERGLTYHASTTYGLTSGGAVIWYHDWLHRGFLERLLAGSLTTGMAHRWSLRSYAKATSEPDTGDTVALYGTELYGLPTQPILRVRPALAARRVGQSPGVTEARGIQGTSALSISLQTPHFAAATDAEGYTLLQVPHSGQLTSVGNGPFVPLLVRSLYLPPGTTGMSVTLAGTTASAYPETVQLAPRTFGDRSFGFSTLPFTGTAPYPAAPFWTTVHSDTEMVELTISAVPVRYDPLMGEATLYNQMDFQVTYDAPDTGAAVDALTLAGPVSVDEVDLPITATVTLTQAASLSLRWVVEDAGGAALRGGETLPITLTAGTSELAWVTDTLGWLPGPKVLHVMLVGDDERVVATAYLDFVVVGRSLALSTDAGVYGAGNAQAVVRAEVRDETGAAVTGLSGELAQTLDGTPVALTWHAGAAYTATLDLSAVATGTHVLSVTLAGGPAAQVSFGVDRDPPTSTLNSPAVVYTPTFAVDILGNDDVGGVDVYRLQYRAGDGAAWTDWLTRSATWDYERGQEADLAPTFGPTQPLSLVPGTTYCFRVRAEDRVGNVEAVHPEADTCTVYVNTRQIYLPLVMRGVSSLLLAPAGRGGEASTGRPLGVVVRPQDVISPTSAFVLYSRTDDDSIWLKDGGGHAQLMDGARPRLSPDGRYIVYQDETFSGDLYVRDLQTGQVTRVYTTSAHLLVSSWTPGGRIVFDHGCRIYAVDRDGGNLETLVDTWPGSNYCYNDSPDSNPVDGRIAWENEKYGLGVAGADGSNPYWITNTHPYDYSPRWSPDGAWLAFWRDDDLYKIRPDGTGLTQLTFLGTVGDWMEDTGQWAPDGTYLVAAAQVGGVEGLYAVPGATTGMLTLLVPRDWEEPDWVGSVGRVQLYRLYLPLVRRE